MISYDENAAVGEVEEKEEDLTIMMLPLSSVTMRF